jgi:multiple sugar transport system permease protein
MSKMSRLEKFVTYLLLTGLGALLAAPFMYMISMSLASDATSSKLTFTFLPGEFHFENFVRVFTSNLNFGQFLLNSLVLVFFSMVGQVLVSSLVAYAFARLRAPGKEIIFIILLSTMMIPTEVTLIPQFVLFTKLDWINSLLPMIVPNFFGGAYNIFLLRQFITRIPVELDEAAQIDGLNFLGIYVYIILPLIRPALVAVAIFTFVWNWGAFFGPLIYINDVNKMPLALGVQILSATNSAGQIPPWNLVMVGALVLTVPMILVYFFGQRFMDQLSLSGGSAGLK